MFFSFIHIHFFLFLLTFLYMSMFFYPHFSCLYILWFKNTKSMFVDTKNVDKDFMIQNMWIVYNELSRILHLLCPHFYRLSMSTRSYRSYIFPHIHTNMFMSFWFAPFSSVFTFFTSTIHSPYPHILYKY